MAVIVRYIVVRNGEEKMTFATKKEADAHDKMLDVADNLFEFLEEAGLKIEEQQLEDISLLLAQNREKLIPILRGVQPKKTGPSKSAGKKAVPAESDPLKTEPEKAKGKAKK